MRSPSEMYVEPPKVIEEVRHWRSKVPQLIGSQNYWPWRYELEFYLTACEAIAYVTGEVVTPLSPIHRGPVPRGHRICASWKEFYELCDNRAKGKRVACYEILESLSVDERPEFKTYTDPKELLLKIGEKYRAEEIPSDMHFFAASIEYNRLVKLRLMSESMEDVEDFCKKFLGSLEALQVLNGGQGAMSEMTAMHLFITKVKEANIMEMLAEEVACCDPQVGYSVHFLVDKLRRQIDPISLKLPLKPVGVLVPARP